MTRKRTSENDLSITAGASPAPSRRKSPGRTRAKHTVTSETPSTFAPEPEIAPEIALPQAVASTPEYQPTREEIAKLAFLYWEARGCQGGSPEEDWLRAERELLLSTAVITA
jgi:hypothetical protein